MNGELSEIENSPFDAGWFPYSVVRDNDVPYVYVANNGEATISAYHVDDTTGALESVKGSPFKTELGPYSMIISGYAMANK